MKSVMIYEKGDENEASSLKGKEVLYGDTVSELFDGNSGKLTDVTEEGKKPFKVDAGLPFATEWKYIALMEG